MRMFGRRRLAVLGGALIALVSGGCVTSGASDATIRHHPQDTIDDTNPRARLVLGSRDLVGRIAMTDARIGSVGELARGEVTVQNLSNNRYQLEYQYAWEDAQGFSINENRVWRRFVLAPRELRSFQTVADSPDAHGFTMTVRFPEDFYINQERYLQRR